MPPADRVVPFRFTGLLLLALALVVGGGGASPRAAGVERVEVFRAGEGGYALYRIPGVVVTPNGTVLACCEARASASDWGRSDLLYRRSTDGGRTWDAPRKLVEPPRDAERNPVAVAQRLGRPGEITMNNPVMIAGRGGGAVHLMYCVEYARCFYTRSDDDGRTWAEPVEITGAFEALRPAYDWRVIATGPGHGIQLRNGRLLVPVWLSTGEGRGAHRPSAVATIYSDDDGRTWHAGAVVVKHPELSNPSESAAVELSDGRVMLSIRHEGRPGDPGPGGATWRAVSVSPDGATDWTPVRLDEALPEPVCMASLLRYERGAGKPTILFANPQPIGGGRVRQNLTVKLSTDDGATWPAARSLDPGPAGYSDLGELPDGTVLCLYERGAGVDGKPVQSRSLTLARFDLNWVREGEGGR